MRIKRTVGIAAALLIAAVTALPVSATGSLLKNGDFSDTVRKGWADWELVSYAPADEVSAENGVLTLVSSEANDVRLCQTVKVEENTVYVLRGEIAAERVNGGRGATLAIDNYSADGSFIYSDAVTGSSDFRTVTLNFRTGAKQTEICVALRLGGYSEVSSGTAKFRNVTLTEGDGTENGVVSLLSGVSEVVSQREQDNSEARKIFLRSVPHLLTVTAVALAVFSGVGLYRNRERLSRRELSDERRRQLFACLVLLGLALRGILCSLWHGHDTDMSCWTYWGNYIAQFGPGDFYTAAGHEWFDYPPAYMLVLAAVSKVTSALRLTAEADLYYFMYMLPAVIADMLCGWLLMKTARERGMSNAEALWLAALVILNPAMLLLSGAWGQIDSILALVLLLAFRQLMKNRRIAAGAIFGLAVMVKWQALMYGPALALCYLFSVRSRRELRDTALGVAAALAVIVTVSLPFRGSQSLFWVVGRFLNAAGGYDYASVEAYNLMALLGGNWVSTGAKVLGLISYRTLGLILMVASLVSMGILQRRRALRCPGERESLWLASAYGMLTIYTFGFYMHERYVFPVILLLLFAYVYERKPWLLLTALLLSCVVYLNGANAMYVISELASAVVRGTREHNTVVRVCSLAETALCVGFLWRVWRSERLGGQGE